MIRCEAPAPGRARPGWRVWSDFAALRFSGLITAPPGRARPGAFAPPACHGQLAGRVFPRLADKPPVALGRHQNRCFIMTRFLWPRMATARLSVFRPGTGPKLVWVIVDRLAAGHPQEMSLDREPVPLGPIVRRRTTHGDVDVDDSAGARLDASSASRRPAAGSRCRARPELRGAGTVPECEIGDEFSASRTPRSAPGCWRSRYSKSRNRAVPVIRASSLAAWQSSSGRIASHWRKVAAGDWLIFRPVCLSRCRAEGDSPIFAAAKLIPWGDVISAAKIGTVPVNGYRGRGGRRGALPSDKLIFGSKSQSPVEGLAKRRGVQPHGLDAAVLEIIDRPLDQPSADAAAAPLRIDQHHGDPTDGTEDRGRRRSDHSSLLLGRKTAVRFHGEESPPVGLGLVPIGLVFQPHGLWQVFDIQGPQMKHITGAQW